MDKNTINSNGYEYIDLRLPSGILWASCNVGASKPSDYGFYFQWGDTHGYTKEQVGIERGQKRFSWTDYKWNPSGNGETFTKYATKDASLELEDDAAHVNMEGDWHMPSPEQCKKLIDNTSTKLCTMDGVGGMRFTSKKDTSKFIFIPAAGDVWDGLVGNCGRYGYIWSSMLKTSYYGCVFNFGLGYPYLGSKGARFFGLSVRGVIG